MTTSSIPASFAPYADLAAQLLPFAFDQSDDGAHDVAHLIRVWNNARAIHAVEGGDPRVLVAATLLHDCVSFEKNDPRRSQASRLAADRAGGVLGSLGWSGEDIQRVRHAIEAHSFSANIAPETIEAMILQDADRLDAIGLVGVARCFYVAGRMGSGLYDPADPRAEDRPLDDARFALDHFTTKLSRLSGGFRTGAGQRLAADRHNRLMAFRDGFLSEIAAAD